MEKCKEIVKQAGIIPDLQLAIQITDENGKKRGVKGTGPHRVKLISDKVVMGTDYETGKERHEIKLVVEEDGQQKQYCFPVKDKKGDVHYLVQRLAEFEIGDEVILEYKRKGLKGYINIQKVLDQSVDVDDVDMLNNEDISIIDENAELPTDNSEV